MDDSAKVNEMGDGKLKRRTVSSVDINRLAQPKTSRSVSKDRSAPEGGSMGTLSRARSIQNLSPRAKTTRTRQTSFDNAPRTAPDGASRPRRASRESSTTPRSQSAKPSKTTPRTTAAPKPPVEKPKVEKPKVEKAKTEKPKVEKKIETPKVPKTPSAPPTKKLDTPLAKSTPKVTAEAPKVQKEAKKAATPPPSLPKTDLKKQLELEDLEDENEPKLDLKIEAEPEIVEKAEEKPLENQKPDPEPKVEPKTEEKIEPQIEATEKVADGKSALESSVDFTNLNLKKGTLLIYLLTRFTPLITY